jgi:6-phosphogluconolactonase
MLNVFKTSEELLTSLADAIVDNANDAIQKYGRFSFVLSGGSSPKKLFALLASDAYRHLVDWPHVFFFFGDERNVPKEHNDSNFKMANESLFEPLGISADHIFRMKTELGPEKAAANYEQSIRFYFGVKPVQFDYVLLGLGDDAHTASLFPHTTVLTEQQALVKDVWVEKLDTHRITLTAPCINAAKQVAFLLFGSSKQDAVFHIHKGERNADAYPAQLIQPTSGKLSWYMDEAAAGKL